VVALADIATDTEEKRQAVGGLHTLGHHLLAEPVDQVDDAPDDVGVGDALWEIHHKGFVDLDLRDGQVAQISERGKPVPKSSTTRTKPFAARVSSTRMADVGSAMTPDSVTSSSRALGATP
jgi:hypothetical protein